ncbi:MAG: DUF3866 family protein [Armatimonadota bacterium]
MSESDSVPGPPAMERRVGVLGACRVVRAGCSEWDVEVEGRAARAVAYTGLVPALQPGDRVLLNTTALALSLGTGGVHFVIARLEGEPGAGSFPGREAGHLLKLRYTPLQMRVCSVEEEVSPHRQALERFTGLERMPVLAAELHSQAAAAVLAARWAVPGLRVALLQLDTAALPFGFSRLAARLRSDGHLCASVTVGQGFGGDLEAVNVYSGLAAAKAAADAELVVVSQGPGNAGTGTEYGFSGLGLAEALHACDTLGGAALLLPRLSMADPRPRHQGLSHHTRTLLRCLRVPVRVPVPAGLEPALARELAAWHCVETDAAPAMAALEPYRAELRTMGRTLEQDELFFRAAAAAGVFAAREARTVGKGDAR